MQKNWHSCKDTLLEFSKGMYGQKTGTITKTCDKICDKPMSKPCELNIALDLSLVSFHSVAVGFAILCFQGLILVNLNASTLAFIKI